MARKTFLVNGKRFETKTALTAYCSAMLKQPSLSSDDEAFLACLLDRHPERDQKVGSGVARFFVAPSEHGTRCFWIERTDGSRTEFSYKWCIGSPKYATEVRAALRELVTDQVVAARDAAFTGGALTRCAITGEAIGSEDAHVDHRPPDTFLALVERFLAEQALTYDAVAIEPTRDAVTMRELTDRGLAQAWCEFHRTHAVLQVVSKRANLSQGTGRSGDHG